MWYNSGMKILAIESSCDETAAAVVEDGVRILSNVVVSQIDIFATYGGVIPEVSARSHLEAILPVIDKALADASLTKNEIDAIAVTHTPGLLGSLLIGTLTARMLAILWKKPLYAVHHLKSHIYANWLEGTPTGQISASTDALLARRTLSTSRCATPISLNSTPVRVPSARLGQPEFPLLALVVSGGHTQIIYMRAHNEFEIIGTTRDDAVGECYDKVAKILGLPYPGGPSIDKLAKIAEESDSPDYELKIKSLPHPKVDGLDFSFSGLKTAVLRAVQSEVGVSIKTPSYELAGMLTEGQKIGFAALFQQTATDILVEKLEQAVREHPDVRSVVVAGGVSANQVLCKKVRQAFAAPMGQDEKSVQESDEKCSDGVKKLNVYFPNLKLAGDNAAMVGAAAYFEIQAGVGPTDPYALNIAPRTPIN